nr:integrase, catalytic region, zinc finger, CCHC-type, peptidase aspartic, catalytic [Tanacetum cinerariifolium]
MAQIQEVTLDATDNYGPIFVFEPLHKVHNDNDNYNVFANDREHPKQLEFVIDTYLEEHGDTNITINSLDMSTNGKTIDQDDDDLTKERDLLASLIEKLQFEIDDSKNRNKSLESSNKTLVDKLKDLKKFQAELDRTKIPMAMPISTREPKRTVNQSAATPLKRTVAAKSTNQKPISTIRKQYEWIKIILFIIDVGCSKHMTGNLKLLSNFLEQFLGTVKFGNDQIALILGYGDLVQGNVTIKRVYYVKRLNHNLFFVGQFCDADLEVAFQKSICYIRDSKGNDLLTALKHDILSPNPESQENVPYSTERVTTSNELDLQFSLMFDELLNITTQVISKSSAVTTVDAPNQCQKQHTTSYTSTTIVTDTPPLNIQTTPKTTSQAPTQTLTVTANENIIQAETNKKYEQVDEDEFINIFSTPVQERGETSSRYVDSSNMHTF